MHRVLACFAVAMTALLFNVASGAAAAATLSADRSSVAAGASVVVSGTCTPGSPGFVISSAFLHDANHDFAGVGAASFTSDATGGFTVTAGVPATITPGAYTITARCGGGNLGISLNLVVSAPLAFTGTDLAGPALLATLLVVLGMAALGFSRRSANASAIR